MRITLIGGGYVGLVSAACFADFGHSVVCMDKDCERVAALRRGHLPIYEPGLDALVAAGTAAGRLRFTDRMADAVDDSDIVFIAVGTPSRRGDGHADLTPVEAALHELAPLLRPGMVVATKSTVPVGTGDRIAALLARAVPGLSPPVASNPEFLRQGSAIDDFRRPDRVIIGVEDDAARQAMASVYRPLSLNQAPILFTGRRNAELIKYASNAFLAMKISFINEMADLCDAAGADVQEIARGLGMDRRIGSKFLHAGPGYGGSCFPKDTQALLRTARELGTPLRLVEETARLNRRRKDGLAARVARACGGSVRGRRIALLGLSFKPGTDDMREAPSLPLARMLRTAGAEVVATDPQALANAARLLPDIQLVTDPYVAARGADAIVLVTEWNVYRALDLDRLAAAMRGRVFVDLRNVYADRRPDQHGFLYHGLGKPGRPAISPLDTPADAVSLPQPGFARDSMYPKPGMQPTL